VTVLAVEDSLGEPIVVHVEQSGRRPGCGRCGGVSRVKDRDVVVLADLPCFGRPARLVWHKFRLCCPDGDCEMGSWTWDDPRIAADPPRHDALDRQSVGVTNKREHLSKA
jgi:transposase